MSAEPVISANRTSLGLELCVMDVPAAWVSEVSSPYFIAGPNCVGIPKAPPSAASRLPAGKIGPCMMSALCVTGVFRFIVP